jgi:hypothetical protein
MQCQTRWRGAFDTRWCCLIYVPLLKINIAVENGILRWALDCCWGSHILMSISTPLQSPTMSWLTCLKLASVACTDLVVGNAVNKLEILGQILPYQTAWCIVVSDSFGLVRMFCSVYGISTLWSYTVHRLEMRFDVPKNWCHKVLNMVVS